MQRIIDEFKEPYGESLSIYRSAPFFIEVMAQGIDKAASLRMLIEQLGIKQEEVISFGDGYND
ncbi:MAG: HAD hydrolase family protein [Thomasclavelia sp.]